MSANIAAVPVGLSTTRSARDLARTHATEPLQRTEVRLSGLDCWSYDVAGLAGRGVARVDLEQPIPLASMDPPIGLGAIAFLRQLLSYNIDVCWILHGPLGGLDASDLAFLPPPSDGIHGGDADAAQWRSLHRPGQFYWRRGPGFVLIRDRRPQRHGVHLRLDSESELRAFALCDLPLDGSAVPEAQACAVQELVAERVILEHGGQLLTLPSRIRAWPVPYMAI